MCVAELQTICIEYHKRIANLESDKYDLELLEAFKKQEVTRDKKLHFTFSKKNYGFLDDFNFLSDIWLLPYT